jgi:hypothetical protein
LEEYSTQKPKIQVLDSATGTKNDKMTKSKNSHLLWPCEIVVKCSNQNPKIEVLNPAPGTGKEKNNEIAKIHICGGLVE